MKDEILEMLDDAKKTMNEEPTPEQYKERLLDMIKKAYPEEFETFKKELESGEFKTKKLKTFISNELYRAGNTGKWAKYVDSIVKTFSDKIDVDEAEGFESFYKVNKDDEEMKDKYKEYQADMKEQKATAKSFKDWMKEFWSDEDMNEAIKTEGKLDWGFDLTDIPAEKWQELVDMFKLKLNHVEGKAFDWVSPNLVIITGNNPITGDYYQKGKRDNEKGYASYIGITGDKASVLKAKNFIKKNATQIKDESKNQRDFI